MISRAVSRSFVLFVLVMSCWMCWPSSGLGVSVGIHNAHAHSYIEMSLENMIERADRVVIATPLSSQCVWENVAGTQRIVTYHRMQINANVLGSGEQQIWIRTLGGVVGDIGQRVIGSALLVKNTPSLLFLAVHSSAIFSVVGMEQGSFPIAIDKQKVTIRTRQLSSKPMRYVHNSEPVAVLEGINLEDAKDMILTTHARIRRNKTRK